MYVSNGYFREVDDSVAYSKATLDKNASDDIYGYVGLGPDPENERAVTGSYFGDAYLFLIYLKMKIKAPVMLSDWCFYFENFYKNLTEITFKKLNLINNML